MKESFREPIENRIELFIIFGIFIFGWLFSDLIWLTPVTAVLVYFYFGSKYYYFIFCDDHLEIVYPLQKMKSLKIPILEIDQLSHSILPPTKRSSDLLIVRINSKRYKVTIDSSSEDFRKINVLFHHSEWGRLIKTDGNAPNIQEVIKERNDNWVE